MALPRAYIEHQLPGRIRLRVPSKRGDTAFFAAVAQELSRAPQQYRVRTTARTGSILIEHTTRIDPAAASASAANLFDVAPAESPTVQPQPRPRRAGRAIPPMSVTAAGLAGLGLYQLTRGNRLASAVESFWQGYGSLAASANPWVSTAFFGVGLYQLSRGRFLGPATSLFYAALSAWKTPGRPR
jgi:hypothetical protein